MTAPRAVHIYGTTQLKQHRNRKAPKAGAPLTAVKCITEYRSESSDPKQLVGTRPKPFLVVVQ